MREETFKKRTGSFDPVLFIYCSVGSGDKAGGHRLGLTDNPHWSHRTRRAFPMWLAWAAQCHFHSGSMSAGCILYIPPLPAALDPGLPEDPESSTAYNHLNVG